VKTTAVLPASDRAIRRLTTEFFHGRVDAGHRYSGEDWFAKYAGELLALVPRGGVLLDVGCGACQITTHLSAAYDRVIAFDLSDSMLAAARERADLFGVTNVEICSGDASRFPASVKSADVILANYMLQYLDGPALLAHLRECERVLAPGGVICWGLIPNANLRRLWYAGALSNPRPRARHMLKAYVKTRFRWWKSERRGDSLWDNIGLWFTQDELRQVAGGMGFAVEFRNSWFYEYRFHALLRRAADHC